MKKMFLILAMVIAGTCVAVAAPADEKVAGKPVSIPPVEMVSMETPPPMGGRDSKDEKGSKDCIEYKISCENGSEAVGRVCGRRAAKKVTKVFKTICLE